MRIALINGSPKVSGSASGILLNDLRTKLTKEKCGETGFSEAEIAEVNLHTSSVPEKALKELKDADVLVFACPLYVDGLPAHLLSCLIQLEASFYNRKKQVYGIVNCGFYEGIQAETALEIFGNWCVSAGLNWGGGIGAGGGGALAVLPDMPSGKDPKAPIEKALSALTEAIVRENALENIYVSPAMPRILYKMAAQAGWRQTIKKNGGKRKDLNKRLE